MLDVKPSAKPALAAALHAFDAAARRDPRTAGCGYVAADPTTGALAPLLWFAEPSEMFTFLASTEVDLLRFEHADARRIAAAVAGVLRGVKSLARVDRARLSAAFEGWSEIVWLGSFAELCSKGGRFVTEVRIDFRRVHDLGEHAGPIADDELAAFVTYLGSAHSG